MHRIWIRIYSLVLICALSACASNGPRETFATAVEPQHMLWPVDISARVITSGFGVQRGKRDYHRGIDISAPRGANVIAAAPGVAALDQQPKGYGRFIIIDHGNGYRTLYAHLLDTSVRDGERVAAGQTIGRVGKSGNATGYHLHFELHHGGLLADPRHYLPALTPSLAKSQ